MKILQFIVEIQTFALKQPSTFSIYLNPHLVLGLFYDITYLEKQNIEMLEYL
jgi:hypothetical protein